MSSINEDASPSQMFGALRDGLNSLDLDNEVTFQAYSRAVLPIDQYVYWSPTVTLCVQGSLHFSQDIVQNEDEVYGMANVIFTAKSKVAEFATCPINTIYVGRLGKTRYAFRLQQGFYSTAGLWHYMGASIAPAMLTQLLDEPSTIDPNQAVVSNSLPLWLAMNTYVSPYNDQWNLPKDLLLYPSFLSSANLQAPYGTVHIGEGEEDTEALAATQHVDINSNLSQLCADRVRITLYGLQNTDALRFVQFVNRFSLNLNYFGIMNMPVVRDAKRKQEEIQALGMKKLVYFRISYHQYAAQAIGRQLIKKALPIAYIFEPNAL